MLPTGYPPQNNRPTQTESEGLETNIPSKWTGKKSQDSNTHIGQNRLQKKRAIKRDPEGHFIILKGNALRQKGTPRNTTSNENQRTSTKMTLSSKALN